MHILCVFNSKGGVGKSTTSIHVGTAAAATMKVGILDLDSEEGSETTSTWGKARGKGVPPFVKASSVTRMHADIEELRKAGAELVILDCPPSTTAASATFVSLADFVVIPVQPFMPDMVAYTKATRIVKAAGKRFAYLLNSCPNVSEETELAEKALAANGEICPIKIYRRISFSRALSHGLAVTEFHKSGKAFTEAKQACKWILKKIGESDGK